MIEEETKKGGRGVEGMSENQKQRLKKKMKMENDPEGWFLDVTAEAAEKDFAKARKKRQGPDPDKFGWSAFDDDCQHRVYERRIHSALARRPKEEIQREYREGLGKGEGEVDEATGVTQEGVDRMVEELNRNIERRSQFSRPRPLADDAKDVNYISERNRKFNEKLNRHYDKYTEDIRASLERGSAF